MFTRLIGFLAIMSLSYILFVFMMPSIADQLGDPVINAKIRNIKDASLRFASGSDSVQSLADKIKSTATPYINETKKAVEGINTTVTNKANQVKDAATAVQSAYSGVIDAKNKIQNLTETGM